MGRVSAFCLVMLLVSREMRGGKGVRVVGHEGGGIGLDGVADWT
jgi:hypothetical protein